MVEVEDLTSIGAETFSIIFLHLRIDEKGCIMIQMIRESNFLEQKGEERNRVNFFQII